MRSLVQISDLHFGNNDPSLLTPLRDVVASLKPDVLVISGDLVEHATEEEFQQARDFVAQLPEPRIVVPGNHDLAFYNVFERVFIGLDRYKRYITGDTSPEFTDSEIAVIGANTSRVWPLRGGSLSNIQVEKLFAHFSKFPECFTRILVTHHPFDLPGKQGSRLIVGHAHRAVKRLAPVVDILLAGHIHLTSSGSTATRYHTQNHAMAFVQAGTAVSNRNKGEENSFNHLRIGPAPDGEKAVIVDQFSWDKKFEKFSCHKSTEFRIGSHGWALFEAPSGAGAKEDEVHEAPGRPTS